LATCQNNKTRSKRELTEKINHKCGVFGGRSYLWSTERERERDHNQREGPTWVKLNLCAPWLARYQGRAKY